MSERDKEEEKTLEPNLGLLGGGWRAACKEKGKHPAVNGSVDFSLGYSSTRKQKPEANMKMKRAGEAPRIISTIS